MFFNFELKLLGVQCAYECGRGVIIVEPSLVLFLSFDHTHMLALSKILIIPAGNVKEIWYYVYIQLYVICVLIVKPGILYTCSVTRAL
jgi:hypothetical protein